MRKTFLLIALGSSVSAFSQPVINSFYGAGTTYVQKMVSVSEATAIDVNSSGAAVTWNYGTLTQTGTLAISAVAPSGTPGASNFPEADFAVTIDDGADEVPTSYYSVSAAAISVEGIYSASNIGSQSLKYDQPLDFVRFPFTHNASFTQSMDGIITVDLGTILTIVRTGTQTVVCDGYGTLVTPAGTFNDVLRIKTTQTFDDNLEGFGSEHNEVVNIDWISPALNGLILLQRSEKNLDGAITIKGLWVDPGTVGIAKLSATGLNVYPNPSTGNISVTTEGFANENVSVDIYSVTGQLLGNLYNGSSNGGNLNLNVKSANVAAGAYILKVASPSHIASKPLLIF